MINYELTNGILEICIDRPDKKNALNHAMYDELQSLFNEFSEDETCSAILLYGSNNVFTVGADLKDFQKKRNGEDSPAVRFLRALSRTKQPVVAAVEGFAIGIGATMLQHCDFVYAGQDTRFRMPFVSLGLCPEAGSSLLLERIVGYRRANDWLMTGRFFNAPEAAEAGFITDIVGNGEALEKAREMTRQLSEQSQYSIRLTKRMLRSWAQENIQNAFDLEVKMLAKCLARIETQNSIQNTGKV